MSLRGLVRRSIALGWAATIVVAFVVSFLFYLTEFKIAEVYAYRGDRDRAFEWLDRAYLKKAPDLDGFKKDPFLKNLESDFRYKAFLRKLKLPE